MMQRIDSHSVWQPRAWADLKARALIFSRMISLSGILMFCEALIDGGLDVRNIDEKDFIPHFSKISGFTIIFSTPNCVTW